ncbi:EI24 domain-containing protein [Aliiroseovarius subalbicans]|uniref:EI24 domain-containing protein n=1 Tax=Aliiroseovarius subalbicans TaxID=2925840 RepID=UPI001F5900FA|nr:EI24 domain-containing protein [Aliiroseovarius subalbicans]MCI2400370.1 EI24 domain-containing protein [Aliiroseovarius subalbicans]
MLTDFSRALGQLGDTRFRRVLLLGLGLTLGLLIAITLVFSWLVGWVTPDSFSLPWIGEITWVGSALSWGAVLLMFVLSIFLMVPVASAFTGIFLDDVAEAVEDRHYPGLPKVPAMGLWDTIRDSASFFGVIVVVNLLALMLFFFVGPFAPVLFWAVNGYLLGREYFQMAAMRRLGREGANRLRARHTGQIWVAGTLMAMPLSIPIVNLLIPVLGAATFTHMFHRLNTE